MDKTFRKPHIRLQNILVQISPPRSSFYSSATPSTAHSTSLLSISLLLTTLVRNIPPEVTQTCSSFVQLTYYFHIGNVDALEYASWSKWDTNIQPLSSPNLQTTIPIPSQSSQQTQLWQYAPVIFSYLPNNPTHAHHHLRPSSHSWYKYSSLGESKSSPTAGFW